MTLLARWCRFNVVGAMGMALQLSVLAALNRIAGGHYLIATTLALEITLIHNFLWHRRITWRDRRNQAAARQFLRFHLSNGLVSLLGNLGLVSLLAAVARMPLLAADMIAIGVCSLANFFLGHLWAFAAPGGPSFTDSQCGLG